MTIFYLHICSLFPLNIFRAYIINVFLHIFPLLTYNVRCGCRSIEYADVVSDNSETTMSPCEMS